MAFDGAPLRLLEALARGLADKGKYKRENGRDAVSLITLLRRSPDYVPQPRTTRGPSLDMPGTPRPSRA